MQYNEDGPAMKKLMQTMEEMVTDYVDTHTITEVKQLAKEINQLLSKVGRRG